MDQASSVVKDVLKQDKLIHYLDYLTLFLAFFASAFLLAFLFLLFFCSFPKLS